MRLATAFALQLRHALPELLDLLRLRLVRVTVAPRLGLLRPQGRVAVTAGRGESECRERELHCTPRSRCNISGGERNPVTRVGPSPGIAHSGGLSSLQAIIRTVGSPGTPYFFCSESFSSDSSVASIFSGTNRSATSLATVGSAQVCTSNSLQAAHHSANKSIRSVLPVARDCCTAIYSSCNHGIRNGLSLRGSPNQRNQPPTPGRGSRSAQ